MVVLRMQMLGNYRTKPAWLKDPIDILTKMSYYLRKVKIKLSWLLGNNYVMNVKTDQNPTQ